MISYTPISDTVKPRFTDPPLNTDTSLLRQFASPLGKESPYIFSKFNPLITDAFDGPLSVRINGVWLHFGWKKVKRPLILINRKEKSSRLVAMVAKFQDLNRTVVPQIWQASI